MGKALALFLCLTATAFAHRTAQQSAEACARSGLSHRGGNPSYEGLGCASTPERAFRGCCYAGSSNLITYDVGLAQARNGMWCCCRRYVSKGAAGRIPGYLERAGLTKQISTVEECFEYYKPKEEGDVPESEESPEEEKETTDEE
jgi:hypothetical protein